MLKDKLTQLATAFTTLKNKITAKLQAQQKTITEKTQAQTNLQTKLNETSHKLELTAKENSENEKVLEQLLKEFKELEASL